MQRSACLVSLVLALLLAACGPQTVSPRPAAPDTAAPTRAPDTAAPTMPPAATAVPPSTTPRPTPVPTERPAAEATATPPAGPFVLVPPAAPWLEANVRSLLVAPDGAAWLVTEQGVGRWQDGAWALLREEPGWLAGFDDAGRAWWIPEQREEIMAWDGAAWTAYGPAVGWVPLQVPGWTNVAADRRGWVWLVDREAVYAFDGLSWLVLPLDQIGFPIDPLDEEYEGFRLTEVLRDGEGDIWVSDCNTYGESTGGYGARWFDGTRWGGADSAVTGSGCVNDMELDAQGRLWMGVDNELARYTPGQGWDVYAAPEFDPAWRGSFVGDILDLAVDPQGEAWVWFDICGGASCGNFMKLFHLEGEEWVWAGECDYTCRFGRNIAFGPDGAAWFFAAYEPSDDPQAPVSGVYRAPVGGAPELVAPHWAGEALVVDGAGRVWLALSNGVSSVYLYENP